MVPEIKSIDCSDVSDLNLFKPNPIDNFCIYLEMEIGPHGEEGADIFGIKVCTPKWLIENNKPDDILVGRHYLIVFKYDYNALKNKLEKLVHACLGKDWNECAQKLSRIGLWEFEDYREFKDHTA